MMTVKELKEILKKLPEHLELSPTVTGNINIYEKIDDFQRYKGFINFQIDISEDELIDLFEPL